MSNRVLSYRYEKYPRRKKYLFKNKIDRWNTFEGITYTYRKEGKYLLVADLSNFFEGISSEVVCDRMIEMVTVMDCSGQDKSYIRSAVECLRTNLRKWSFRTGVGLPQNRDASSFLSNVMLYDVDRVMVEIGRDYYRYVDDIRIICESEADARRALSSLTRELRKFGFSLNGSKTKILGPQAQEEDVAEIFTAMNTKIVAINNMWKSRSRRTVSRSVKYICSVVKDCIDNGDTQSRSFRFAINRLGQLIQSGLVDWGDEMVNSLRGALVNSLYDHAASTDQYCRILISIDPAGRSCVDIEQYLCDESKSIYDWQNYNLWLFLARHKYDSDNLGLRARTILSDAIESGEAAAILIWAISLEKKDIIAEIVSDYIDMRNGDEEKNWPHLNQRYFLIAANCLDEINSRKLYNMQHYKLDRTTSRSSGFIPENGIPIIDPEPPELSLLIEEANDYV